MNAITPRLLLQAGILLAPLALIACGGGDAAVCNNPNPAVCALVGSAVVGSSPGPSAEGVYSGTMTGSRSTAFEALVLENGDWWSVYGTKTSSIFSVAGFVQGSGTSNNGRFTSSNAKDFGFAPASAGTLNATYDATAKTISGTFSAGTQTGTFSGGPIAGSLYNYNTAAALTTVVGAWSTTSLTGEGVAINVASTGAFTAVSSLGCNFTGTITPRPSGKNVFNVAMAFGAAPCALPGQSATGIALAYPLTSGRTQLLVSAVDGTRSYGAAVFGTR